MSDERYRMTVTGPVTLAVELPGTAASAGDEPQSRDLRAHDGQVSMFTRDAVVVPLPVASDDVARGVRRFEAVVYGWHFYVTAEPARRAVLRERATGAAEAHHATASSALRAQIPGRVVRLWVAEGDEVEQGQRLLAVEAMKMENEIRAPHAGRVGNVRVAVGQLVERNEELLSVS